MVQCVFFTTPSMPMRCYGFSKVGLSMTPSAWNFRNSVLKTRYVHISGKAERDGRQAHTSRRQTTQTVYRLDARGGGGIENVPLYHCTISISDLMVRKRWWEISIYYLYYILYYNIIYNIKYKCSSVEGAKTKISNGTMVQWYTIGQQRLSE